MTTAHINRIGTAVPPHDVHEAFVVFARTLLADDRSRYVFDRMAERAEISHRYSFLRPGEPGAVKVDADGFYRRGAFPGTGTRMARYETDAVELAMQATARLGVAEGITHLVVASCTGLTASGSAARWNARWSASWGATPPCPRCAPPTISSAPTQPRVCWW